MILRPIVENYFKHGMNTHAGVGHISISSSISEDRRLIVVVENNGSSIEEAELASIRANLRPLTATLTGTMPAMNRSGS